MAEHKLKQLLRLGDQPKVPAKISTQISGYPCFRTPTSVQKDLQLIADLLLIHVPEWPESEQRFFAQCYCKDWTLSRDSLITKQIIDARYAALFAESKQAPSVIPIKKKRLKGIFADELLAEAVSQRPIVLLGDVGVGKTAFLKNLMLVEAAPEFEDAICVYLDLGSQGALADDLRRFVLKQLDHQLWDKYSIDVQDNAFVQTLYAADLARFEQGIFSALRDNNPTLLAQKTVEFLAEKLRMRDEHLRTALVHIASTTNRQIIIVLDNSDQRTSDVQIETFAIAQELAKSWAALVFIAMRPETYLHLRQATTTAAEAQRVFTIAPPRIEEVIRLRLRFALEIAEGRLEIKRLQSVTLKLGNFAAIVSGLLSGLRNLSTFFDNFCNGNVANAVQVVHNFIGIAPG